LGLLFFCMTLHLLLLPLKSELKLEYLDDITTGGGLASVSQDIKEFNSYCQGIGLELNINKREYL